MVKEARKASQDLQNRVKKEAREASQDPRRTSLLTLGICPPHPAPLYMPVCRCTSRRAARSSCPVLAGMYMVGCVKVHFWQGVLRGLGGVFQTSRKGQKGSSFEQKVRVKRCFIEVLRGFDSF